MSPSPPSLASDGGQSAAAKPAAVTQGILPG
jgi:hypothetical protein